MQYPVPQFTEVEDKIIGGITLRQFGILLVAGGLVFGAYSATKDFYVSGVAAILVGLPCLTLAFAQFNGRPMYSSIPIFIAYIINPKFMIFRKEVLDSVATEVKTVEIKVDKNEDQDDTRTRLKKIQYQLEQRSKEEEEILVQPNNRPKPDTII